MRQRASTRTFRTFAGLGLLSTIFVFLAGCQAANVPHKDCCYDGPAPLAYLKDVYFELKNGERKTYQEIFPGLAPDTSAFSESLAFERADIDLVVYSGLRPVLPNYDANSDSLIEKPELTVLYLVEGARGFGYPVTRVGINPPVGALNLPQVDVGGLTRYLRQNRSKMTPHAQKIFKELDMLGLDINAYQEGPSHDPSLRIRFN